MRIAVILALTIANILLAAYVMAYLWGLFAVPLGAPVVGPAMAYGVLLLLQAPNAASAVRTTIALDILTPKSEKAEAALTGVVAQTAMWILFAVFARVASNYL